MKKILSLLSLAALTIGLLGSCTKINERIDNLEKKVDGIENNQIASIGQQIATINQSIADLSTIRTNIQTLMDAKTAMGEDITKLKAADQTLEGKINDLKTYVDKELTKYATKDWANATFATLAKQTEIITDVEKLKTGLVGLDTKLDQAIANLDSSLKGWVNEQLSGYYTIAQVDAKVAGIQSDIDALKTDNETNKSDIEKLEADLAKLTQDLATAKNEIKTAYEKAISDAINGNNGYINSTIKNAIDAANADITDLTGRVETLESDVATLKNDVDALKAMIQTVSIIPAYSNGSLKAEDGILTINCVITPKEAVESLKKENFTILTSESEVLTKSALYGTLTIAKDEDLVLDKTNGTATIKVDVSSVLPTEEDKALTVAVNIKNGISDFTTKFVPVTDATAKPIGEYVEIGGVKWATKNLGATTVAGSYTTCYGDLYQWGSVNTLYDGFPWTTATTGSFTWKTGKEDGFVEANREYTGTDATLPDANDVVKQTIGGGWRMPTSQEFKELADACGGSSNYNKDTYKSPATCGEATTFSKGIYWCASYDGVAGCLFCDGTHKLFFPAAGAGSGTSLSSAGYIGLYWSSSLSSGNTGYAFGLVFYSGSVDPQSGFTRYSGFPVRPVKAAPALPTGALKGVFSVSATKKVHFSKGNLVATIDASGAPTAWKFAANQYDCLGEGGANKTIGRAAGDVDLFCWSTDATSNNWGIHTKFSAAEGYTTGNFKDWGATIDDKGTWSTLSTEEWQYLINKNGNENVRKGKYKKGVTVCGKTNCLILAPDDFEGAIAESYDAAAWTSAEAAGLVCLPAAGHRSDSSINYPGSVGYYWSSTAYNETYAYDVFFGKSTVDVNPGDTAYRYRGYSVRLITEVK